VRLSRCAGKVGTIESANSACRSVIQLLRQRVSSYSGFIALYRLCRWGGTGRKAECITVARRLADFRGYRAIAHHLASFSRAGMRLQGHRYCGLGAEMLATDAPAEQVNVEERRRSPTSELQRQGNFQQLQKRSRQLDRNARGRH
jgi:hypothetical protein